MRIGDHVRPEAVVNGLRSQDAAGAIGELVAVLCPDPAVRADVERALLEREAAHTTALPMGVAVPHTTVPGLVRPVLAVGTAAAAIPFGSVPVRLVLVLLSPPDQSTVHVRMLARIARLTRRPGFVESLLATTSPETLLAALERAEHAH